MGDDRNMVTLADILAAGNQPVAVIGWGTSGRGAAHALTQRGCRVVAFDQHVVAEEEQQGLGNTQVRVIENSEELAHAVGGLNPSLIVVSPGIPPRAPVFRVAKDADIPLWGEVELAWQLQESGPHAGRPWLTVTGTNGKTTTVGMLGSILRAAGENVREVGNIGTPITRAVDEDADVFAVELSSFQLETSHTVSPEASVCLNVDADHLDWHGSVKAYAAAKARVYANTQVACIYPSADPMIIKMVEDADVVEGARAIGVRCDVPAVSELGVVGNSLVDRAFLKTRRHEALHLASFADLAHLGADVPSHAITSDALAAAALARAHGVSPDAVAQGLRSFHLAAHRQAVIGQVADMTWIDDSKATNAHAAAASLMGVRPGTAIWIAGGDAKGQRFESLVSQVATQLRGVVLIGKDKEPFRSALNACAPQVPVVEVDEHDDWMFSVVNEAVGLSHVGDTVLLAPATASWDQFSDYGERGRVFADAVQRLGAQWEKQS